MTKRRVDSNQCHFGRAYNICCDNDLLILSISIWKVGHGYRKILFIEQCNWWEEKS